MALPASDFEPWEGVAVGLADRVFGLADADACPWLEGAEDGCLVDAADGWPMTEHAAPLRATATLTKGTAAVRQCRLVSAPAVGPRWLRGTPI